MRPSAAVGLAAALAVISWMLPVGGLAEGLAFLVPVAAAAAILGGAVRHRPRTLLPWGLVAVSLTTTGIAHLVGALLHFHGGDPFPSVADAFHLLAALTLLAGTSMLAIEGRPDDDAFGSFETAIVGIAVGLGVWLAVVEPFLTDSEVSMAAQVWAAMVPLLGAATLAVTVRSASHTGFRTPSTSLLALGVAATVLADVMRSVFQLRGDVVVGTVVVAVGVAAPVLIAAAALDPSMVGADRGASSALTLSFGRIVGLSVAALTPLTILLALVVSDLGTSVTRVLAATSAIVVVVLALARMWGLIATVRSLSERRGQDRLAAMVEHSSDIVLLVDERGHMQYASPGLLATLGHRPTDWVGRPMADLVAAEDTAAAEAELRRAVELGPQGVVQFEASLVRVDGQRRLVEATVANLLGGDAVDGVVVTLRDVTEQRDLERRLSHRAFHDELTGLANRALFLDRMDHALRVARPDSDPVVVLFVDLDDFKAVNDRYGHGVGDRLLSTIAERIRACVGDGDTPARLGGDEFAVLLEDRGGVDRALDVAEDLLAALYQPVDIGDVELLVHGSVGVAVAAPGMSTSSLLRDADLAMYEAKRAGKGQIKIFDPAMRLIATRHLEYRSDLGAAIDEGHLRLVYQPMVDLRTGDVIGAEALVRWQHPDIGDIPPDEFIPIAERSGLIVPMGKWVLDESLRQARRWQERGPRQVSINVSAVQLRTSGFAEQVGAALAIHALDPQRVILEITEGVLVEEIESESTTLAELRQLGVRIAIDDFGTGYCSLSYLQRFPVDIVKIARECVEELDAGPRSSTLAKTILQMTESLELPSIAEGIETRNQLAELRRLGCIIGQGFLLSAPIDGEEIGRRFGVVDDGVKLQPVPVAF